jgi:non-heme chloroperoxidase
VARYIGRHGTSRVSKAVLLSGIPPLMMQSDANPAGVPAQAFEDIKKGILNERSQFWKDVSEAFFSANRPGTGATQGNRDAFWFMAMQESVKAGVDCVTAFAETDFTEDLRRFDIPTLIVHGDDDQIVPIDATGRKSAEIIPGATLKVYEGGAHGLAMVPGYKERFSQDLLEFLRS